MRLPRDVRMPVNGQFRYGAAVIAAAGTNQATGTQINSQFVMVTGADGTKGVVLPSMALGMKVRVINTDVSGVLKVYPFSGDSAVINVLSADAALTIQPGQVVDFVGASKTQIWTNRTLSTVLAAGTTSVAPLTLTAGTNLTTPAAGAVEYDGTAFYATPAANTREQIDAEQYVIASADSATYNNTGLDTAAAAAVFTATMGASANGALTLIAGKTYAFEAAYILTNTGTTSHTWAVLFGGTATMTTILYDILGVSLTSSAPGTGILIGFGAVLTAVVATAASTSATENVVIKIKGMMVVNAGGTLIPQLQASARPGATGTPGVIVKKGSYFRAWQMGGAGTVGNWS